MTFKNTQDFLKYYKNQDEKKQEMLLNDFWDEIESGDFGIERHNKIAEKYVKKMMPSRKLVVSNKVYEEESFRLLMVFTGMLDKAFGT